MFTGLRQNEKLHEHLISVDEVGERRVHELITHVAVDPLAPLPSMCGGPIPTVRRDASDRPQRRRMT